MNTKGLRRQRHLPHLLDATGFGRDRDWRLQQLFSIASRDR